MRRPVRLLVALCGLSALVFPAALAGSTSPSPATPAQVTKLVGASNRITSLSVTVANELPSATSDFSWTNYPSLTGSSTSRCLNATDCVYGDVTSTKVMVLFGDSHALIWLPALAPVASAKGYKLILLWQGNCPAADLSVYVPRYGYPAVCNAYRTTFLADIKSVHPAVVVIGELTTQIP